ncbi:MAG: hypothetical protein J0I57_21895, partial [Hyphomicrobium sp.]|nr:hypothetical protein [Hyphomicrobium sp.]
VALVVHRFLLALLIALAVTLAPISAAMAAAATHSNSAQMADMPDCPSKAKQTTKDCSCCDTKAPCQGDLCLAKCFKLNGEIANSVVLIDQPDVAFFKAPPGKPPDNWSEPLPRPPSI